MTTSAAGAQATPLRVLGVLDASFLVVGSIVGGGIFLVSGEVARGVTSPAGFVAVWIVGGLVALAGALCNGELGAMFPRGGGEYVYLREAYGPSFAFLSGWTSFWIGFPGSIAALAWGLGGTVAGLVGAGPRFGAGVALGSIVALTAINALGLRWGKSVQNALSGAKLLAFGLLLVLGASVRVGADHFSPFFGSERPSSLALALVPVLFAYSGWNAATYVAGELRDPTRTLGRALVAGTALCIALYLAVNVTYLRALSLETMRTVPDVSRASIERLGGRAVAVGLGPLVAVSILSSLQATVLTGPRIYQAMARDRLFFSPLARLDTRTRVPVIALVAQAGIACALLLTQSFERLLTFAMFAIVSFSTLTVAAVVVLRLRRPNVLRPFRLPGFPFVPALFIAVNLWVLRCIVASGAVEVLVGLAIVATGAPAYLVFRARARRS